MSEPTPPPTPADKVQSTATGELLARLATTPKLDAQRFVKLGIAKLVLAGQKPDVARHGPARSIAQDEVRRA